MSKTHSDQEEYSAKSIVVLTCMEAVRRRPAMYAGDVSNGDGQRVLVQNWVEWIAARTREARPILVEIVLHRDGTVSITDDGQPPSIAIAPGNSQSILERLLTEFLGAPHVCVVNALSSSLQIDVCVDGARYIQRYARGVPVRPLVCVGPGPSASTTVHYRPDPQIFAHDARTELHPLVGALRHLVSCDRRLDVRIEDRATGAGARLCFPDGLRSVVEEIAGQSPGRVAPIFHVRGAAPGLDVWRRTDDTIEIAAAFHREGPARVVAYEMDRALTATSLVASWFHEPLAAALARAGARRVRVRSLQRAPITLAMRLSIPLGYRFAANASGLDHARALVARLAAPALDAYLACNPAVAHALTAAVRQG